MLEFLFTLSLGAAFAWAICKLNPRRVFVEVPVFRTSALTFEALRAQNVPRCNEAFHPLEEWTPTDWATALAGEAGEACNVVKKIRRLAHGDRPYNRGVTEDDLREKLGKELADTVIYADLTAARMGLNLGECVRQKFNEVSDRVGSERKL